MLLYLTNTLLVEIWLTITGIILFFWSFFKANLLHTYYMFRVLYCQTYTKTTVLCLIIIKKFQTLLPNSKVTDCLHIQTISSCSKFKALLKPAQTAKTNILEKRWSTRKSWGKRATVIVKRYASQWSLKNSSTVIHTLALVFFLLFLKD